MQKHENIFFTVSQYLRVNGNHAEILYVQMEGVEREKDKANGQWDKMLTSEVSG